MTSRERVRAVLNHEQPDRIPNGLGGCETAGLHVIAYDKLQQVLGVRREPPRVDTFMTNAVFEPELLRKMGGDILLVDSPRMCPAPLRGEGWEQQWKEQELWGRTFRVPVSEQFENHSDGSISWVSTNTVCPAGACFFDSLQRDDLLADYDFPSPDDYRPPHDFPDGMLRRLENTARALYEETEFSLCMGETITDLQYLPGGMVGGMIYLMERPEEMDEILQKSVEAGLDQLKLLEQAVGKYVDILSIAHDFGDNRCVTIGDPLWRRIYKPYYKKLFQGWKAITGMKINLHSCGAVRSILGDLIECGLDVYNPVQLSGDGMDPAALKEEFGRNLVFWGGAYDTQFYSPTDSYETVYQKVSETIRILSKGGGYIMAGVHNLPPEVPGEHLRALLDAWRNVEIGE